MEIPKIFAAKAESTKNVEKQAFFGLKMKNGLQKDTFEKSPSFTGAFAKGSQKLAQHLNPKVASGFLHRGNNMNVFSNAWVTRVDRKLLRPVIDTMSTAQLGDGTTVFEAIAKRGDALKHIQDGTFDFINLGTKKGTLEAGGKELGYVLLNDEPSNPAKLRTLTQLKELFGEEEYQSLLDRYLSGEALDFEKMIAETIKFRTKPLQPEYTSKLEAIQDLLADGLSDGAKAKLEDLRLNSRATSSLLKSDPLEFGYYLRLPSGGFDEITPQEMFKRLNKVKSRIPKEVYDSMLEKCVSGKIDAKELYDSLAKIRLNAPEIRTLTPDGWTKYIQDMVSGLEK